MTTEVLLTRDDGRFPNSALPALIHRAALNDPTADAFETTFAEHGWTGGWRAGLYAFHHYHSTAHEALGVFAGSALLQLGGPEGVQVEVRPGDVIVVPAGVAHRCVRDDGLRVVGAYADGRSPDLRRGEPSDRPDADAAILAVPTPTRDPVAGAAGGVAVEWSDR